MLGLETIYDHDMPAPDPVSLHLALSTHHAEMAPLQPSEYEQQFVDFHSAPGKHLTPQETVVVIGDPGGGTGGGGGGGGGGGPTGGNSTAPPPPAQDPPPPVLPGPLLPYKCTDAAAEAVAKQIAGMDQSVEHNAAITKTSDGVIHVTPIYTGTEDESLSHIPGLAVGEILVGTIHNHPNGVGLPSFPNTTSTPPDSDYDSFELEAHIDDNSRSAEGGSAALHMYIYAGGTLYEYNKNNIDAAAQGKLGNTVDPNAKCTP